MNDTQTRETVVPLGTKLDRDKPRWDLMPPLVLEEVVKVLTHGAKKYSPDNWRHVDELEARYYAAAMRHLQDWRVRQNKDPESGLHHLAHAICSLMFIAEIELEQDLT